MRSVMLRRVDEYRRKDRLEAMRNIILPQRKIKNGARTIFD